jgi:hypothetical protein
MFRAGEQLDFAAGMPELPVKDGKCNFNPAGVTAGTMSFAPETN